MVNVLYGLLKDCSIWKKHVFRNYEMHSWVSDLKNFGVMDSAELVYYLVITED